MKKNILDQIIFLGTVILAVWGKSHFIISVNF